MHLLRDLWISITICAAIVTGLSLYSGALAETVSQIVSDAEKAEKAGAYDLTMYVMAGILVAGFLCNLAIGRVKESHYMTTEEIEAEQRRLCRAAPPAESSFGREVPSVRRAAVVVAWMAVGAPLAWGIASTLKKALLLFA